MDPGSGGPEVLPARASATPGEHFQSYDHCRRASIIFGERRSRIPHPREADSDRLLECYPYASEGIGPHSVRTGNLRRLIA